jgi:NADH-quinone oxidoreductase subunit C
MMGSDRFEVVRLRESLPDAIVKVREYRGDTFVCVQKVHLLAVLEALKTNPELEFDYFSECLAVDYSQWEHERDFEQRFEVVYNLMSLKHQSRLFIKIGVDEGESVPTAKHLYLGAEYPEKEITDLYGIRFEGNELEPETRFLLPDDWVGYPLRKEYPLGGEDVVFDQSDRGPAVEDLSRPHAGESFDGKTGSDDVSGR